LTNVTLRCKVLYIMELDTAQPSPEDARAALATAEKQRKRARRVYKVFSGASFIIWGSIYALAYGITHFRPELAGLVWLPLAIVGFVLSFALGARIGAFIRSPAGQNLRALWTSFGIGYFLLAWALSARGYDGLLLSFVINLLVAYALLASSLHTRLTTLARAAALLALTNALFFALLPGWYDAAMSVLGLLGVLVGLRMVGDSEV